MESGQIYIPFVNRCFISRSWLLLLAGALQQPAAAYGIAVTGTDGADAHSFYDRGA